MEPPLSTGLEMKRNSTLPSKMDIRNSILSAYKRELKPSEIMKECQQKFGPRAPSLMTVMRWFQRFKSGDFSLKDEERGGRHKTVNVYASVIKEKIIEDPRTSQKLIAQDLELSAVTVSCILSNSLCYKKRCGRFVPQLLQSEFKAARIEFATKYLEIYKTNTEEFLERFVTVGEVCISHKISEPTKDKEMLWANIFWNCRGILLIDFVTDRKENTLEHYLDLIDRIHSITHKTLPTQQLEKRKILFHHDIEALHLTKDALDLRLTELGYELVEHPPQSPDLSPCDFFLFENLQKWLSGRRNYSHTEIMECVKEYFNEFKESYFADGLKKLERRWMECIDLKGEYIDNNF